MGALLNDSASSLEQKGAGARWGAGLGVGSSVSVLGALPNWPKMHHQFLNLVSTMPRKVKREERENTDGHGFQFH